MIPLFNLLTRKQIRAHTLNYCVKLSLAILYICLPINVQAQLERSYYNYNSKDGLNALHIYSIVQDSKGFMWIGTSTGLLQFDGVSFKTIKLSGLKNPEILELKIDEDDNLWFINLFNQLCRYSPNHKLDIIELNQERSFFNIWIKDDEVGAFYDIQNGITLNRKTLEIKEEQKQSFRIPCLNEDLFVVEDSSRFYLQKDGKYKKIVIDDIYKTAIRTFFKFGESLYVTTVDRKRILRLIEKNDRYLVEKVTMKEPFFLNGISELSDSLIYINTRDGIHIYNEDFKSLQSIEFPNVNVTESLIDNENNLWLSTINKGLIFSNYSNILSNTLLKDLSISAMLKVEESLYIGTVDGKVFESNKDGFKLIHEDNGVYIRFLLELNNGIIIGTNSYIIVYQNGEKTRIDLRVKCLKDGISLDDSQFIIGSCTGYLLVQMSQETIPKITQLKGVTGRVFCLHKVNNENAVLISTISGIQKLNIDSKQLDKDIYPDLKEFNIIDIEESDNNNLWLATSNSGVLLLRDSKIEKQYSTKNELNSNFVNDLYLDKNDKLWVSTASGINIIDTKRQKASYITSKDGLNSNIVQTVYIDEENVYVGTANGLNTYNKNNRFANINAPPIYINEVTVDGSIEKINNLKGQENTFRFNFQGLNYSALGRFTYKYRLKGLNDNWETVPSSINDAVYNSIPPGDYTFEVYAINEDGIQSEEPAQVSFTMPQVIYFRWWFVLITMCALFGFMNWYFASRLRELNRKNELELSVRSQQLIALKAQMKPHFISNILNSIQSHSMLQDPIKVNQYITRLSKFVRNVLKMSDAKVVSLKDELDVLETYIELEQMRADLSFGYVINVEDTINTKRFFIPPMLIQPYIENAIKHGVSNIEDGLIQINIEKGLEDTIIVNIKDNGIGIEESIKRKKSSSDHISVGIDKSSSRLDLLKAIYKKKFVVNTSDLTKAAVYSRGTQVELVIGNMSEIANAS